MRQFASPKAPKNTLIDHWLQHAKICLLALLVLQLLSLPLQVQAQPAASIAAATRGLSRAEGFIPFYWDEARGRVLMEIPAFDEDVLYYISAASGAGSVEIPLDRGILDSKVIHFHRSGPKVMVVEQNIRFRALDASEALQTNMEDSFAKSVLASLPIEAVERERVLVDASSLFMRDAAGVEARVAGLGQGSFHFEQDLSAFYPARMKAFPDNTEIETLITFRVKQPGVVVRSVAPEPSRLSLRIHHSFLRAPTGYQARKADPRIGVSTINFRDHAKDFDDGTHESWITRWRLEKQDPDAAMSEPVKPIIFYLDPAIPEPVRSAMREGTLWWNEAFEAAGFRNAVQVADPTPDMDPMDIRYAWVLWIDRDERGFSSGGTFRDPRTGEILGSKTRMDSHRIRTIANYWESYMATGDEAGLAMPEGQRDMVLLRQALLTAHELGHALGFGHNWASSLNERASVMEYPTPRVKVSNGQLDLSESFQDSIGIYDTYMVRYAYTVAPAETESQMLESIITEMREEGIIYVPDTDPRWAWYDDRATPTEYLSETMAARDIMLAQYGPDLLKPGEPIGALRDMRFWMTYLHHRWAIESAQRYVGGMFHNIPVKGESLQPEATQIVEADLQRQILDQLMQAIAPQNLVLPESLLAWLTPHPGENLEDMSNDYAFDQLRAARILAALVVEPLLSPDRAARMVAFADRDPQTLGLPELVETLLENTWASDQDEQARHASLRRVTQGVVVDALMRLGANPATSREVRAYVLDRLTLLGESLEGFSAADPLIQAHYRQTRRDITRYLANPAANAPASVAPAWGSRPRSRYPLHPGPPL